MGVLCTHDDDCSSPDWIRVRSRCEDSECHCTEPLFGDHCEKDLTVEYRVPFLVFAFSAVLLHAVLLVGGARNLHHHLATRRHWSFGFSVRITSLMIACNLLSMGFYAMGLNFGAKYLVPIAPWSVYFFFEGGACVVWVLAIAEIVRYWLDVFATSRSAVLMSHKGRLYIQVPMVLFVLLNVVLLVYLMTGEMGYHTWMYTYVGVECVLTLMLLVASRKILEVIRRMHGTGEKVAVTTLNLMLILVLYICYDVLYITCTSHISTVGPKVFLAVEGMQALLWLVTLTIIMEIGFKGLSNDPPWRLRMVQSVNAWTARRLGVTAVPPTPHAASVPTWPAGPTDLAVPAEASTVCNPTVQSATDEAAKSPNLSPAPVVDFSRLVGTRSSQSPSVLSGSGGSIYSVADDAPGQEDPRSTDIDSPPPDSTILESAL